MLVSKYRSSREGTRDSTNSGWFQVGARIIQIDPGIFGDFRDFKKCSKKDGSLSKEHRRLPAGAPKAHTWDNLSNSDSMKF